MTSMNQITSQRSYLLIPLCQGQNLYSFYVGVGHELLFYNNHSYLYTVAQLS